MQIFQVLLLLKGIHASPESLVRISNQLPFRDQAMEWLLDQVFPLLDVVENLPPEDEEAAIDQVATSTSCTDIFSIRAMCAISLTTPSASRETRWKVALGVTPTKQAILPLALK